MLFTRWEVRIGKNCARGPFSRPRAQFFPIRTDLGWWFVNSVSTRATAHNQNYKKEPLANNREKGKIMAAGRAFAVSA